MGLDPHLPGALPKRPIEKTLEETLRDLSIQGDAVATLIADGQTEIPVHAQNYLSLIRLAEELAKGYLESSQLIERLQLAALLRAYKRPRGRPHKNALRGLLGNVGLGTPRQKGRPGRPRLSSPEQETSILHGVATEKAAMEKEYGHPLTEIAFLRELIKRDLRAAGERESKAPSMAVALQKELSRMRARQVKPIAKTPGK